MKIDINIEEYYPMVHSIASAYYSRNKKVMDYEDVFQNGCVGLMKAYNSYDENKDVAFSTYAYSKISGEIKVKFRDCSNLVKMSRDVYENKSRINQEINAYELKGEKINYDDIIKKLNISKDTLIRCLEYNRYTSDSYDIAEEGFEDVVVYKDIIYNCLNILSKYQRNVVVMKYLKGMTMKTIALKLNKTQAAVTSCERRAMKKIKKYVKNNGVDIID